VQRIWGGSGREHRYLGKGRARTRHALSSDYRLNDYNQSGRRCGLPWLMNESSDVVNDDSPIRPSPSPGMRGHLTLKGAPHDCWQLHYLGCDRSDAHLDFTLLGADLAVPESVRVPARAANVEAWLGQWRRRFPKHQLCVCFEQPAANLIVMFSRFEFVRLYPVNPATLKSYRETFVVSRARTTKRTAIGWRISCARTATKLPNWEPLSPAVRKLAALVEGAATGRPAHQLSNKLVSLLKNYFPEALDLIGEHAASALAVAFLRRWPTLQALQATRWSTVDRFYRDQHCVRSTALARRQEVIKQARPLTDDPAILEPATLR